MAKEEIVRLLDEIRQAEITASLQYMAHHSEYENLGADALAKTSRAEAIEEMRHAETLAERIYFLGGRPTHKPLRDVQSSVEIVGMLKQDVQLEEDAIERLNRTISVCVKESDAGTRQLLEGILKDEETHLEELQQKLNLIERFGPTGYMMCVCGSGVPMPQMPK